MSNQPEQPGQKEDYQELLANALEWIAILHGALNELVEVKKIKDAQGKTDEYEERQPKAWYTAFNAIELFKKDDGFINKPPVSTPVDNADAEYWRKRCEAAEMLMIDYDPLYPNGNKKNYENWLTLKIKTQLK